ncbi:oxygenase MpaB family protein [Fulvivirga ligni]|uniref:oxygenase MpaB family protein n=1 Tax=Fulvivirga ligni TaxID=2904246 RepID=UPI001F1A4022|nr:oxygenase MpaB family protein [Fulvivirga ligni]UII19478.1 DUF2236 domain-containing protein [Fulvivirga ligni]
MPNECALHLTDAVLESKRSLTDPIADQVVAQIIESGYEEKINDIFYTLVRTNGFDGEAFSSLPDPISQLLVNYFDETSHLPSWADPVLIAQGEAVFSEYGPEISMILNVKSLPLCYACSNGAEVLYMTGRLTERSGSLNPLARRLMETSQMIMNALAPGGMSPTGNGIITIQKVRLIHASIRYFIQHERYNPKGWNADTLGKPINQEDLAGTLMSFGPLVLKGLQQMNIELSDAKIKGYMHAWKVIGYLMGVEDLFLTDDYAEGWNIGVAIMKHQAKASDHGKELTKACIDFLNSIIPGNLFDEMPEYMIWYFSQDVSEAIGLDIAAALGVREGDQLRDKVMLKLCDLFFRDMGKVGDHSKIIFGISCYLNRKVLQGFLHHFNDNKNVRFSIPPSLQDDWKLNEEITTPYTF